MTKQQMINEIESCPLWEGDNEMLEKLNKSELEDVHSGMEEAINCYYNY